MIKCIMQNTGKLLGWNEFNRTYVYLRADVEKDVKVFF